MHPHQYGYSRGVFYFTTGDSAKHSFRTVERFRYALRNEFQLRPGLVEQIVAECEQAKVNATRCDCNGTVPHHMEGGYNCPVAFHNDGGSV